MLTSGVQVGPFRILAMLGAGGMGEVYRARDDRLQRDVAIKVFAARDGSETGAMDRFLREAQAASALNHPNIVTVHEVGETDIGRFIVMELVEGRTLRDLIGPPMAVDTFVQIATQMARALATAHAAGIAHRDIKPENIMVRDDGYVKVLDFGLARVRPLTRVGSQGTDRTAAVTEPGMLIGTLRYMSPEQASGGSVHAASDIFSLGIVLYELLTGRHPFAAESALSTLSAIAHRPALGPCHLNPEVPPALDALILQMLEKNELLRPSAAAVASALVDVAGGVRVSAPTRPVGRRTVGRAKERAQLKAAFDMAVEGHGLVVCVSGEPGLGKTTLVEDFLNEVNNDRLCWIGRGRCSERLAGTEVYLPFLEALDSMIHSSWLRSSATPESGESVASLLKVLAPAWYAQVAPMAVGQPVEGQTPPALAASQDQMKRSLVTFFQEVSRLRPLVLFLDDIHWADVSTTDLLAYLAARLPSMPVLVVATYRQSDLLIARHPFIPIKLDLQSRGIVREVALEFLTRDDVQRLLALQFADHEFPPDFVELIHTKTEGNPLFIMDLLHDLRARKVIAESNGRWVLAAARPTIEQELPESVRSMIRRKIEQLNDADRRLLVAAAVQGPRFDSTILARVLGLEPADVEESLTVLDQVHSLVRRLRERDLPDGSLTVGYQFVHVLYQNALYASLTPSRKIALSAAVATALIGAYGEGSSEVATELALLFEAGREFGQAAKYFLLAAQNASRLFAHHEAVTLSRRGIAMLDRLPASAERDKQELLLQLTLGSQLLATQGYAARELGEAYARARLLCERVGEENLMLPALLGLGTFCTVSGDFLKGREYSHELLTRSHQLNDTRYPVRANVLLGVTSCMFGHFAEAVDYLEPCISVQPPRDGSWASVYGASPGVSSRGYLAFTLILLGYPDRALDVVRECMKHAHDLSHALSEVSAWRYACWIHQLRREPQPADDYTSELIALSTQQRFAFYQAWGTFQRGWARSNPPSDVELGLREMQKGEAALQATGAGQLSTYRLALLAEAFGKAGRPTEGLTILDQAVAVRDRSGETFFEAELHRLRGELLSNTPAADTEQIEDSFLAAVDVARRQEARWLELRASTNLSRLWKRQGHRAEAWSLLNSIYSWFIEGFDTPDMQEAKALLGALQ